MNSFTRFQTTKRFSGLQLSIQNHSTVYVHSLQAIEKVICSMRVRGSALSFGQLIEVHPAIA